ncbi:MULTISPECIES: DegT/DnrJ/EryC1/StrS aminotransferase family protein [unclassified Photobacterium]|uniref:DegT/DnrJ/EryC1/StrS family aminotransferase n=1 Tax=unclassified Photobacterium TaxID=2628852 RepID=UPI000D16F9BD|nr:MULTISPECIES: DegT/DnrJ/EryC1/StrS aminotransferase family protein [unclassified Photobacterium]PSV24657.1 UDP-4-amino-4,6-dideoxy-N-acetyl-beta-L-altrosamine transaminase [Photobacterium sp. GB-56]PSV58566.1 UDP-4-amino-4,6-dideoxy-N-acetyl-beta-L-altrosamine transaminase [Photobacterium sp. GB-3]
MSFIPYSRPVLDNEEINEVIDTLKSGWLTTGPKVAQFENDFKDYVGVSYALAVNSATSGLHLALEAIGVGPGDQVITTVHTFTATAEVIRYLGAEPIFVDIESDSYNISSAEIELALKNNSNVKAIMPVHYAGQSANITEISKLAKKYGVKVVEDAAHALPTTHNGKIIGSLSDITVFSFYANKTITTGEGGMITTNDPELAERMKIMRLHGINRDAFDRFTSSKPSWYYEIVAPGFKYNMMDVCGALGIHQLKKAKCFQEARESIANRYNKAFSSLPVITPVLVNPDDIHAWHIYVLQLNLDVLNIGRDEFIRKLSEKNIGTSVHYIPLHRMPYWKDSFYLSDEQFPNSSRISDRIVSLPNYASMTDEEVNIVIDTVRSLLLEHKK